jgi:hypothetical protein
MTTMNKKELILQTLEKMGYKPEIDDDGDVTLRYQLKRLFVLLGDENEQYTSVLLPQFYEMDEGEEPLILAVCNKMNRELKMVKLYIDQTFKNVSAVCEFFFTDENSLQQSLSRSLDLLGVVRSVFRKNRKELSED